MAIPTSYEQVTANAPDGAQMGKSATEKIAFYGATPIVQPVTAAAGTDAATTQTLANAMRTALRDLGLMA